MARIAFLQNFWYEFLGTMYISALLKDRGHTCEVFIESGEKNFTESITRFKPDLIGFYTTTGTHGWALSRASKLKKLTGSRVILGGPHPTFFPEVIENEAVDIICMGEGEYAMIELAERLDSGKSFADIQNLHVKSNGAITRNDLRPLIDDLDTLPPPDRALYDKYPSLQDNLSVFTGRGCPFDCSFCFNRPYIKLYKDKGKPIRRHSPRWVIEELKRIIRLYKTKFIRFDDEVFILNNKWLTEFLPIYKKEIGLPFTCLLHVKLVTPEVVELLKESGCQMAYFGIESGNEEIRNVALRKGIKEEEMMRSAELLNKAGIKIGTYNMLGLPGETVDKAFETVHINQRIGVEYPWCSLYQPYPGTDLENYCREKGLLGEDYSCDSISASFFKRSVVENKEKKELERLQKLFHIAVQFPSLEPLIRFAVRLPITSLLDVIFYATYGYRYMKTYKVSLWRVIITGLRSREYI
ncbi:MAG: B12-binding domain-containing radical SAM protein [Candidatus Schekmanbacteria bacterium]|nr:B12-binding domain-containing radical SAM protein [Candidatus Schekmanbacteria bacterium]